MKYCPVCKIEYSDKAKFCKKCEAYLMEKESTPEVKTDFKRLLLVCIYTGGFILFIMVIYYLLGLFI